MKRCWIFLGLIILALLLSGCGRQDPAQEPSPLPTQTAAQSQATPLVQGELAEKVRGLMATYDAAIREAAQETTDSIAYTTPGDVLMQMARDALDLQETAHDGRYSFTWHSQVESTYVATMDDAQAELDILLPSVTPDPKNDAPIDSQQFGDYAVAGGGLYDRTRTYDMTNNLTHGTAEITETLNGETTGQELFSFDIRGNDLYFVDATLDVTTDLDELVFREGYLVAVGVLRPNGLDTVEYHVENQSMIPDPATLNLNQLLSSITPDRRVSVTVRAPK